MGEKPTLSDLMDGLHPFRRYYRDDTQRGSVRPLLDVAAEWDNIPNSEGERITPGLVATLMDAKGLGYLDGLSDSMAHNLQLMKETQHYPDVLPDGFVNPVAFLRRALPKLMPAAEDVSAGLYHVLHMAGCPEVERRQQLIAALDMFIQSSDQILRLTKSTGGSKSTAHWHDDAYFLAIELHTHAREIGRSVALSKYDSGGVKLIEALLNLAMVNHSGSDAIAKELNRRRSSEPFLKD